MFKSIAVAARDRGRMAEVSAVIARFGLDSLAVRLGIGGDGKEGDDAQESAEPRDLPTRTRKALEALGPTYVKLGQILATRRDLLPDPWIAAFEQLQSDAPRLPFETLRGEVEAALGGPPESVFARFDTEPLAAASIAQVHRARLHDGTEVVVKIRRPGIRARMEADLRLMRHLGALAEARSAAVRRMKPAAMIEQLGREILDELDFTAEGRNADLLRADLASLERITVPRIHWEWTGAQVLVMDYIEGIAPRDPAVLKAAGIDPSRIAALGAELVLEMVLVNGRFHADPHPGNLLCLPPQVPGGDGLALLDLGSVGFVSPRRQHEFLTFILALRSGDPGGVADMLATWSQDGEVPREKLLRASERLVSRHGTGALVLNAMVADFFPLLRQEGLVLPPDLVLIFKAMVTMDGVLSGIAPDFDLSEALGRMRGRLVASRLSRLAAPDKLETALLELSRVAEEAPRFLRAATVRMEASSPPARESGRDSGREGGTARAVSRAGWLIGGAVVIHAAADLLVHWT
ncbi:ubiquinone biosynthesis protein [Novosphingobium sp. PhB55]|uniref:ABC1 kinase family protein n=1 Tax=Novosphingobium sp. PhB55 TaxID=2485106 RepID=UPI001066C5DE|nr:AarF/UbiB family protein [Novosphingobium sp. PhB55]TDW63265.1 ubiquinone biosynthesis protein [Novosphingobium sp. PhB55]